MCVVGLHFILIYSIESYYFFLSFLLPSAALHYTVRVCVCVGIFTCRCYTLQWFVAVRNGFWCHNDNTNWKEPAKPYTLDITHITNIVRRCIVPYVSNAFGLIPKMILVFAIEWNIMFIILNIIKIIHNNNNNNISAIQKKEKNYIWWSIADETR